MLEVRVSNARDIECTGYRCTGRTTSAPWEIRYLSWRAERLALLARGLTLGYSTDRGVRSKSAPETSGVRLTHFLAVSTKGIESRLSDGVEVTGKRTLEKLATPLPGAQ